MVEVRREAVIEAVRRAGREAILPRFRALSPGDISTKSGPGDLVTLADTEAEAMVAAELGGSWPAARVVGEEGVAADPDQRAAMAGPGPVVIVDPVDGTWNFAKGLALFGTIAAVTDAGRPVWGMLHDPLFDDWIEADETGTRLVTGRGEERPLRTSGEARLGRMQGYAALGLYKRERRAEVAARFGAFSRVTSLRCACHEYRMVAQGLAEFALSGPKPHPWDHAAGVLAVQAAGGVARFLDGGDYTTEREKGVLLAAGSEAGWEAVAEHFDFLKGAGAQG